MALAYESSTADPCAMLSTMDDYSRTSVVAHYRGSCADISASVGSSNPLGTLSRTLINDKLPIEVLVGIFTLASATSPSIFDVENYALWNGRKTLAAITAVCRLWRIAALGAQSLWSTIVLPSGSNHLQECLEYSLYYSKKSAIDIFFFRSPGRPVYEDHSHKAREHDMIMTLLSHNDVSSRVRVLSNLPIGSLSPGTHQRQHVAESLLRNAGQMIEAVGMLHWEQTDHSCYPLTLPAAIEILESLPGLRRLSMQPPSWHTNPMAAVLRSSSIKSMWGRLIHLNIAGPPCIHFLDVAAILRECVLLEEAQFSDVLGVYFAGEIDEAYGPMFGRDRLVLPHLRQLVIQKFDGDATWLLDAVSCPAIAILAVKQRAMFFGTDLDRDAATKWESFIERTFSMSTSQEDVLQEIWINGLPTESIEYILSSRAAKGVRSIALALDSCMLDFPGCAPWPDYDIPSAPLFDVERIYNEVAEEYRLLGKDILHGRETIPWYGWNHSTAPLRLGEFAVQCLHKLDVTVCVDTPTNVDLD